MKIVVNNFYRKQVFNERNDYNKGHYFICNGTKDNEGCESTLLVSKDDVKVIIHTMYPFPPEEYYCFVCPICGKTTVIDINIFTSQEKEEIDETYESAMKLQMRQK